MSRSRGFSLVEVLLAVFLMSTGLLALYAAMTYGVKADAHGRRISEATNAGREILSLIKGKSWAADASLWDNLNDPPDARRRLNVPPFQEDMAAYAQSDLRRNLSVTRLALIGFERNIVSLKVVLYWSEGQRQNRLPLETYDRI